MSIPPKADFSDAYTVLDTLHANADAIRKELDRRKHPGGVQLAGVLTQLAEVVRRLKEAERAINREG